MLDKTRNQGWIYVLWNPSFPKFVKIGRAADIDERISALNTATPFNFQLVAKFKSENAPAAERAIHKLLHCVASQDCDSGEFFKISRDNAASFVATVAQQRGVEWKSFCYFKDGKKFDSFGAPFVEPLPSVPPELSDTVFRAVKRGAEIHMRVTGPAEFTVLKGSRLCAVTPGLASAKRAAETRIRMERAGVEKKYAKNGVLKKDRAFDSPHVAAAVMLGRQSANGYREWVDGNGKSLKDYIDKLRG